MENLNELKQAQTVFNTLCTMLDEINWNYNKDEDALTIYTSARGEDLPMDIRIEVDAKRQIVVLLSELPFSVAKEKRADIAVAVSCINLGLFNGSFDYNYLSGDIFFRLTSSFMESLIGPEMFHYLMSISFHTIDEYNDKLLMVAKGDMSIPEIVRYFKD